MPASTECLTATDHGVSNFIEPEKRARFTLVRGAESERLTTDELQLPPANGRQAEFQILSEVTAALASSLELTDVLHIILTGATASQGLGFNRCFLFRYDPETRLLEGTMAVGPANADQAAEIWGRMNLEGHTLTDLLSMRRTVTKNTPNTIAHRCVNIRLTLSPDDEVYQLIEGQCGKVRQLDEVVSDLSMQELATRLELTEAAFVPLVTHGICTGMLVADNRFTCRPILDADLQLLETLAFHAALALERALLYQGERDRNAELERINHLLAESHDKLAAAERLSFVGQLACAVADELRRPLSVIGGCATLLPHVTANSDTCEYAHIIESEVGRAERVLSTLHEYSLMGRQPDREMDWSRVVSEALTTPLSRYCGTVHMAKPIDAEEPTISGNRSRIVSAISGIAQILCDDELPTGDLYVQNKIEGSQVILAVRRTFRSGLEESLRRSFLDALSGESRHLRLAPLIALETCRMHGGSYACEWIEPAEIQVRFSFPVALRSPSESPARVAE